MSYYPPSSWLPGQVHQDLQLEHEYHDPQSQPSSMDYYSSQYQLGYTPGHPAPGPSSLPSQPISGYQVANAMNMTSPGQSLEYFTDGSAQGSVSPEEPLFTNAYSSQFQANTNRNAGQRTLVQPSSPQSPLTPFSVSTFTAAQSLSPPPLLSPIEGRSKKRRFGPDSDDDDDDRPKPVACKRCKGLKVKCNKKTPCDRCLKANYPCQAPLSHPRRRPPKREELRAIIEEQDRKIKEQNQHIKNIDSMLEELQRINNRLKLQTLHSAHTPADLESYSPLPSSSLVNDGMTDSSHSNPAHPSHMPSQDVEDWIAKARESITGFIGLGGAGIDANLLYDEDYEDSDVDYEASEGEGPSGGESISIKVVGAPGGYQPMPEKRLNAKTSSSSLTGALGPETPAPTSPNPPSTIFKTQKLATIPTVAAPWGAFHEASQWRQSVKSVSEAADDQDEDVGVAGGQFFTSGSPGPDALSHSVPPPAPHILARGIVTPADVEKLFAIYFERMNCSLSLLDPALYSAKQTYNRSSFLLTVVCAIASRHYTEKPNLYPQLMQYAQLAAGTALISGEKNVEMCHGYILLALYPVPARRWQEDRCWLYLGLAIRVANDLNLHHPNTARPKNEHHAREMLNRTRCWLNCFNLDRSMGSQYGKAPIIRNSDFVAWTSEKWWHSSPYNLQNFDIHLCCYNAELKVMSAFREQVYSDPSHPTGLNKDLEFEKMAIETDDKLVELQRQWFQVLDTTDQTDEQNVFRSGLLRLAYSYSRLIALSFGFQHAFGKNNTDENPFLTRCLRAASDVVDVFVNDIGRPSQRIYLRHGPEAQSVFVTFAATFLVKLLQPKFSIYLNNDQRLEIREKVQQVINLLGDPDVAIDNRHGPKLYSRFLEGLLATPMAQVGRGDNDAQRPRAMTSSLSDLHISSLPTPTATLDQYPRATSPPNFYDQFSPSGPVDPFAGLYSSHSMFEPPLATIDADMRDQFQALASDSSLFGDLSFNLPGFNWMNTGTPVPSDDPILFDFPHFPASQHLNGGTMC